MAAGRRFQTHRSGNQGVASVEAFQGPGPVSRSQPHRKSLEGVFVAQQQPQNTSAVHGGIYLQQCVKILWRVTELWTSTRFDHYFSSWFAKEYLNIKQCDSLDFFFFLILSLIVEGYYENLRSWWLTKYFFPHCNCNKDLQCFKVEMHLLNWHPSDSLGTRVSDRNIIVTEYLLRLGDGSFLRFTPRWCFILLILKALNRTPLTENFLIYRLSNQHYFGWLRRIWPKM